MSYKCTQSSILLVWIISLFAMPDFTAAATKNLMENGTVIGSTSSSTVTTITSSNSLGGVTYTRWGRTTCSGNAKVIYKGYMAGPQYNEAGGGSNYLCLPEKPQWKNPIAGRQAESAYLYGVEYELFNGYSNNNPLSYENLGGQDLYNREALCVVCYKDASTTSLMIPGMTECPAGPLATLEYRGYLMADRYEHHRSQFICVDEAPEAALGPVNNDNQGTLYLVQAVCGSLSCADYSGDSEVTCVVCTNAKTNTTVTSGR